MAPLSMEPRLENHPGADHGKGHPGKFLQEQFLRWEIALSVDQYFSFLGELTPKGFPETGIHN